MKTIQKFLFFFILPALAVASVSVGIGQTDITPPEGIPSAGYTDRKGEGMEGTHDPLFALAMFINNGEKSIALCSVDHLGFTYEMVQAVMALVQPQVPCEIYIGSSHTHSGGGAYLNIPFLGASLAGPYREEVTRFYVEQTAAAIVQASQNQVPAKVGIGYGKTGKLSKYRGLWPVDVEPLDDVTVIKVTHLDGAPLAVLFNYPVHPTVLKSQNRLFSADFVGYTRDHIQDLLGTCCQPIYFNGAQGDIIPTIFNEEDRFDSCDSLAKPLAETVKMIWDTTSADDHLEVTTQKDSYGFKPQATPFGLTLSVELYQSEMNLIVLNQQHAFLTIPGELSCLYDTRLKEIGSVLGYAHVSIFGLTNDAHGYIILPEAWEHKTFESGLSFGGKNYGDATEARADTLLKANAPPRNQ